MDDPATILGKAKQAEIKHALHEGNILEYVTYLVSESDFRQNEETNWAFISVATYLDDGWTAQQGWTTLAEHCLLTKDELGQAMNQLVGGTRYDKSHADALKAPWTRAGEWPRRSDLGAFMFYVCAVTSQPEVLRRHTTQTSGPDWGRFKSGGTM